MYGLFQTVCCSTQCKDPSIAAGSPLRWLTRTHSLSVPQEACVLAHSLHNCTLQISVAMLHGGMFATSVAATIVAVFRMKAAIKSYRSESCLLQLRLKKVSIRG